MPNLEDILNGQKTNLNLVVKPRVSTITQEELDAYRDGIDAALESGLVNKEGFTMLGEFSESTKDAALNNNDYLSKLFTTPNRVEQFNTALNQVVEPEPELDSKKDVVLDTDKSDILARYDFPLYADTEDLAEQQAYNDQTNMEAIWKGAKNIVPVAIGLGAEMLGGAVQGINNQLGDDDYSNWMMDWGNNFMKKYVSPVYQNPDGKTFDSPKSAIAAGADIFGQFGSAVGSMVAMTPINKGIVGASTAIGATIGGVPGAALGSLIGVISAAALNAYSEGVIEAADVFDTKKAELLKDTNNYAYSHETAKLAAGTTATQNMLLNTALNIIPVMWSVKPYGVDRAIKNSLNLHDTNLTWFRLQKPYVPTQLAGESADDLISRLAKIKANDFANNAKYSMISNPWEALKNIRGYGSQKLSGFKYNVRNPAEFLRRNWDVVGETFGEGLEEYHNYFARQQGLAVYNKDDASMIPSIPKLMQGYSDLITKGEGTHDFVAGTIIGGMSAPIFSSVRFGRSKVYNPDTGEMEFKYQRHKMFDFIPWELNRDFEQKDYESTITNSLMMLQDAKELSHAYINSTDESEKEALLNRMLVAPITHYVDTNMLETYKLSLDVFKDNISNGILHKDESVLKGYMSDVSRKQFEEASNERLAELANGSPDMAKLNQYNVQIEQLLDNAAKEGNKHIHKIQNKIDFVKKTADEYKKVKQSIETTYGGIDYGYANALFKNKTAMDMEEDIFKRVSNNRNSAYLNLKNVVSNANPNLTPEQLSLKIDEELQDNSKNSPEKDAYIESQSRYYESLLRKTKFSQRYNSLNSWGYENDSDLMEEMTLMEQLNMVSFTEQELIELGINDNIDQVSYLESILESLKSIPTPTREQSMQMGMIEMFLNKTNEGVKKLFQLNELIKRIKAVQDRQVSNQENFKSDDKTFKDFNPLLKFIKRNKLFTAEAKKLSKAKNDIDIIQSALVSYKKYADVYADYLTEKDKQTVFETGVEELQKMLYLNLLNVGDTSIKDKLERWLKEHDDKFGQVIGELMQIKLDNPDNESINTYINRMIEMMQYQKDVVDQLKTLNTVKDIKLGSTYENIIQSLNNSSMSVENAINNITQIMPNNDLRKAILSAINDLQSGVNTATHYGFKSQYSYNNSSINYYTNGTDIFIENGKLEKFSHKDGKIVYEIDTSFLNITTNSEEYNLTLEEITGDNIANLLKLKPIEFYINDFMIKLMNKYSDVIKAENIFTKSLLNQITTFTDKSQFALEHKLTSLVNIFENLVNDNEKVSSDIFDELGRVLFMFNNKEIFGDYEINGILLDLIDDNTSLINIILEGEKVHVGKTNNSWVSIEPNSKVYVNKNVQDLNLFRINGDIITIIPNVGFTPAQVILINTALDNDDFSNINFSYEKVDIDLSKNTIDKSTYVYNEKGKFIGDSSEPTENIMDRDINHPHVGLQIYLKLDTFKEEQTDKEKLIFDLKQKIQTVHPTKLFDEITYFDLAENVDKMNFIEYQLLQENYHNPNLFLFYISKNYNTKKRGDNYEIIYKLLKDKYLKKEEEDFIKIFDVNTALIHKIEIQNKVQVKTGWENGHNFYIIDGSLYYKPEGTKLYLIGINGFVSSVESNIAIRKPLNNSAKQLLVLDDNEKKSLISVINHSVNKIGDTSLIYPQGITIDFGDISKPIDTESYIYTLTMYGNNITIDGEDVKIEKKGSKEPTTPVPYTYDEETFNTWWSFVNDYFNVKEESRLKKVIEEAKKTPISKTKEELFPVDSLYKGKESGDILKVIGYTKDGVRFQIQTSGKVKPTKNLIFSELKRLISEGKLFPYSDIEAKKAEILKRKEERLNNVKPAYHHTKVDAKDFDFNNFQRGKNQISQFGDGLNASTNTTSFLVKRYGKAIQGEVNDSDFVVIDTNKSQKELYQELISKGFKFNSPQVGKSTSKGGKYINNNPEEEYDGDEAANLNPAILTMFNDFQQSNSEVKGVKIINHIIGGENVAPFYVIYDAKSFYGQGSLTKKIEDEANEELRLLEIENSSQSELDAKIADIEKNRLLSLKDIKFTEDLLNNNRYWRTGYYKPNHDEYVIDGEWNEIKGDTEEEVINKVNEIYDIEYLNLFNNNEFTLEQALQFLKEADRENGDVYKQLEELLKNSTTISPEVQQKINTFATLINSTPIKYKGETIETDKVYEVIDNKLYIFSEGKHEDAVKVDLSELFKYKYQDNVETLFTRLTERALYIDLEELFSNDYYIFWVIKMIGIKKQQVNSRGAFTYFLNDALLSYIIRGYSNDNHKQQIELYSKYIDGILQSKQPIHLWRKVKETDVDYIDDSTFMYSSNADKFSGRNQLVRTKRKGDGVIYIKVQDETNPKVLTKELYKDDLLKMMINGEGFIYTDDIFEKTVQKNNEDKIHLPFKSFGNKFYFNGGEYFIYKMKTGNNLVFLKNDKGYYLRNEDIVRDVDGMIMFSPEFKFAFPIKNKKTKKPFEFYPIEGNYLPFTSAIINEFKTYLTDNKEFNLYSFIHYLDGDNKLGVNDYIQNFSRKFFKRAVDSKINESEIPEKVLNNTFISFIRLLREVSKDVNFKSFFRITDDIVVYKGEVFHNKVIVPNENLDNFILTNLINFPFNSTNVQGFIDKFNLVNIKREDINPDDLSEGNNNDIYGSDPTDYTKVVEDEDKLSKEKLNTISAIAESDKVLGTFTINHFDNRLDKIYGDIKNVAKLRNKRKADKELFLKRGLYQKDNSSKITEVKVKLEKIPKNKVNNKALLTVNDYAEFLSKVYDNNSIKDDAFDLEWLYNEGILEFLTFFAYYGDEWNIKPEADDFNTITNPVDRKAKIMDLFINNSALLAELSSYGKELFINSRIQINASIDYDDRQDNHIGFMHDLSYLFNEDRSVSLVGKNIFGKKKEDLFDEELRFVLLSMSKKMEIIDKLKDENVVSLNYEIRPANNGKLNKNDFNGGTRKISSILSMRNHNNSEFYQLVADKETGDRYGFKLKSFGERENDIVNIFEEMATNGIALDYIYNIILPQIREKTINEKLAKLYEYLLSKGHVENISNLEENYQYKRVLAIYSFFNKDKVNIIKDFEHDFIINYLWKGDEAVGIINNLFLTRVNNPFQRETIRESDKDYFKSVKRYYSIENLTINELANSHTYIKEGKVKGIYNENTVKDAAILKDLQKRIEVIDTFINKLKERFITLFTSPDETFLFNEPVSNSKDIAEQMGAIFKRTTRNFPTFLAEHEIVGILAKKMSDYNSAFMGRIDVVYSNLEKERKIYLTVKKNNDITIVKLYDGTLKSNEKSEFIVYNPIKTKIKTGDNKGKYSYTSSEKSTTTLDVNGVKDLLGFVSLTLASSNSKFRTMPLHPDFNYDALSINNYSDLIKLVTKSFLNGIEDTFFINPIISIENQIKDKTDIVVDNDDINKGNTPNDDTSTTLSLKSFVDEHILEGKTIENFKSYYSDISSYLGDLDSSIKNSNFKLSTIIDLINDSDLKSDYNKIINESNKETLEHIENVRDFVNDLVNFLNNDDTINTLMEKSCPF